MITKHNLSYKRRFLYGWLISLAPFLILSFFAANPARYLGTFVSATLIGSLLALGIDKLSGKKLPIWAFVILCFVMTVVMRLISVAGQAARQY